MLESVEGRFHSPDVLKDRCRRGDMEIWRVTNQHDDMAVLVKECSCSASWREFDCDGLKDWR
jgi:hypothetical protein